MPKKIGKHLTYEERCHIYAYLKSGKSNREIAKLIGCSHTTINNELKRNLGQRGYRSKQAHEFSKERRTNASSIPRKMTEDVFSKIKNMLQETQSSPVQISGRLAKEYGISISPETIYKAIWADKKSGGELYKYLRHKAKKYNKRSNKLAGRGLIPNRKDISERPLEVEKKERIGDFELDTIVGLGHKGAIVSIVDRASKFTFLRLVSQATAQNVSNAICEALDVIGKNHFLHTLTSDNGKEFSDHEKITQILGGTFYFAKPYHSWERGLNEHTNGLVRQYFPKGTDFSILNPSAVAEVEKKLNNRPRKVLNFNTPFEVFSKSTGLDLTTGNFHG